MSTTSQKRDINFSPEEIELLFEHVKLNVTIFKNKKTDNITSLRKNNLGMILLQFSILQASKESRVNWRQNGKAKWQNLIPITST